MLNVNHSNTQNSAREELYKHFQDTFHVNSDFNRKLVSFQANKKSIALTFLE